MRLNLIHLNQLSADLFSQKQTVAGGARMVRRSKALQTRYILGNHFVVGAEAAGRVNHSLGVNGVRAVLALNLQADHTAALVGQDLFGMRVGTHVDLEVLSSRVERADNFRADERTAGRTMRTGLRGAGHQTNVAEIAAVSKQPVNGRGRFRDEGANERRVIEPMTALHRVIEHDFDGVFRALGLLQSSANSIQTARGTDRIAADHGHLFHYDDVGAEFVSLNGGGQACTTRTDHGNVNGDVFSGAGRAEAGHHSGSNENLLHVGYFLFLCLLGVCSPFRGRP